MQVAAPGTHVDDVACTHRELARGIGVLAAVLAGVALVFWVAANWPRMTPDARLTGVQGVLALLSCLAAGLAWRGRRGTGVVTGLAGLATGALLALVGQIYQTGADAWPLFLHWAVLILPWVALVRDGVLTLLWAALLNLALWLWLGALEPARPWLWALDGLPGFWPLVLNAVLLALAEWLLPFWHDPWRLLRRVLAAMTLAWAVALVAQAVWMDREDVAGLLLGGCVILGVYAAYARWRPDPAVAALAMLAGIGVVGCLLAPQVDSLPGLFGLAALLLILGLWAARHVLRLYRGPAPAEAAPGGVAAGVRPDPAAVPWAVTALRMGILVPVVLLLGAWVALSFDLDSATETLGAGVLLLVPGLCLGHWSARAVVRESGEVLTVLGLLLCAGGAIWLSLGGPGDGRDLALAVLLAAGGLAYAALRAFAVRLAVAGLTLGTVYWLTLPDALRLGHPDRLDALSGLGADGRLAVLLLAGSLAWIASLSPVRRSLWRPFAWAAWGLAAGLAAVQAFWLEWFDAPWMAPGMGGLLLCAVWPGVLLLAWMVTRWPRQGRGWPRAAAVGLGLAGLGWLQAPLCAVALTGWVLGRWAGNRRLQAAAVLAGLAGLALFYLDETAGTLLDKALTLGLTALWLGVLAAILVRAWRPAVPAPGRPLRAGWWRPAGLLAGGVLVLVTAQVQVHHYETILAQGRPVVLALAPVDPRSLMQGDYMALDYAVRREAEAGLQDAAARASSGRGWLPLRADAQGVWQLAGVPVFTDAAPAAEAGLVVLAFHWRDGRIDFGARSWFFPEGQGDRYARAQYGVLRVAEDGTALLAGLLDADQVPL